LAEIKKHYSTINRLNTQIYALSTDSPAQSKKLKANMGFPFELLCDEKKDVITRYGLLNPFEHGGIARPAIFIIRPDGVICYRSIDGTARRVDLSHALEFMTTLHKNPQQTLDEKTPQKWIFPSLTTAGRTMRNMVAMGNFADWKHFLTFPGNFIVIPVKKWLRKRNKK
jgi:alkyl hydroperoxide reductase subunit AhpC